MNGHWTYVLTENLLVGRVVVGHYDHVQQELQIGDTPVYLGDWFPLAEIARVQAQPDARKGRVNLVKVRQIDFRPKTLEMLEEVRKILDS